MEVCIVGEPTLQEEIASQLITLENVMLVDSTNFDEPIEIKTREDFDDCLFIRDKEVPHYRDLEFKHGKKRHK